MTLASVIDPGLAAIGGVVTGALLGALFVALCTGAVVDALDGIGIALRRMWRWLRRRLVHRRSVD